ncbi:hypothetical protein [Bradyrhizobium sp. DASA03007]|uniref:hypothetical protein n=1 Tax=unclassified Bradyrhizobium TaxID=2631580 RepID=UPI003F71F8B8
MDFCLFKNAVAKQFKAMSAGKLFCTDVEKDDLWSTYIGAFPAGTNPVYRERTEHDCSCCRQFIRAVGNVVSIDDNHNIVTIWDGAISDPTYAAVSAVMASVVKSKPIVNEFLTSETSAGTDKNFEDVLGKVQTWEHFHVRMPKEVIVAKAKIGPRLGETRSTYDVFKRGLTELTIDAVDTVLELIGQNSLYRGTEHKFAVDAFRKAKQAYDQLADGARDPWIWLAIKANPGSVTRIRNTGIGTLLIDLSEGMELEDAVRKFEKSIMAPENYKRPTALVTPAMIKKAKETVQELGLTSALERRYARLTDISAADILFADHSVRSVIAGDVFDSLPVKKTVRKLDKVEEIGIEKFLSDVVPRAQSLEVMLENRHVGNLVSLIAPVDPTAEPLFKWGNNFSWSYNGDMADSSMRQKVQERGGRVDGVLRFTHMWNHLGRNASLMDLHVFMPGTREHKDGCHDRYPAGRRIGWNQRNDHLSGGIQDVDYVDAAPAGYVPVENITFPDLKRMPEGVYTFKIHNWSHRQPTDSGFSAEIEFAGNTYEFEHPAPLKQKEWVTVARVELRNGVFTMLNSMASTQSTKKIWGLDTQDFHKVNTVMLSPNFWGNSGAGNKHYFFMIDGCQNDGEARGFYNEFLRQDLEPHRKVINLVGSKMKAEKSADQVSGLGFSSTQRADLVVKVAGNFNRTLKVVF